MSPQRPPGSTNRTTRTPPAPAARAAPAATRVSYEQKCVVLVDWWLERLEGEEGKIRVAGISDTTQMRKGASSSKGNRTRAGRVFKSAAIVKRHDYTAVESMDGFRIWIGRLLNIPRTRENGFSDKVCDCFEFGFPVEWQKLANPNMDPENEHAQSPSKSTANAPSHSVEYYMEKFLSGSFTNSMRYAFPENDFNSSTGSTGDTGGPAIQRLSKLSNCNAGYRDSSMSNVAASEESCYGIMDMPEEPLAPHGKRCNSNQASAQHESTQVDAAELEIVDCFISSISAKKSTGSICSQSKIVSIEKEGYMSRVGCGQAEQNAYIQHENMHRCSSEQEMVIHPIDPALVDKHVNCTSSDSGECGTPKRGKASVNLGTADAFEVPTQGMTSQSVAVRGSEDSTVRRLRSGKVFGMPSSGPTKRANKRKKIQHEASNEKMVPNEGPTPTANPTSHENGSSSSAARIDAEDKQQSHDSRCKGRRKPAKKGEGIQGVKIRKRLL